MGRNRFRRIRSSGGPVTAQRAACLAFLLCSLLLSGGVCRSGVIGNGPAPRVHSATAVESLRPEIESGLSGEGRLFSVSPKILLQELYLPLGRRGVLKELSVLLPSENAVTDENLAEIRNHLAQAGLSPSDRETFRLEGETIRGRMDGIDVRFFPLTRIPVQEGREEVLILDPAFLLLVYRNEVKTPIVDLAWKLIVTLRDNNVRAGDVVLLDLPPHDDPSLRYGFLPSLLGEMIVSPAAFSASVPEKWEILRQAETAYFFAQYPDSMALYRKYLDRNPGDASACYKIAMMAARDMDDDMALQWLNRAAATDPRYVRGFVEVADYLVVKNRLDPAERTLRAGAAAFPKDSRMATSLAGFFILRGQRSRGSGDLEGAAAYFAMAARVEGAEPAVRDKASRLWKGEGEPSPSVPR